MASPVTLLWLYVILLVCSTGLAVWLEILNFRCAERHAAEVPAPFRNHIESEAYRKSVDYTLAKGKFAAAAALYSAGVLLVFVLGGWFGRLGRLLRLSPDAGYTSGVIYVLGIGFIFSVLGLPLDLYSTFVIEEKFGFNKTSFKLWCIDRIKELLLSAIIAVPLLYALFWFVGAAGVYWWLYGFAVSAMIQLAFSFVYPVWIAPWFNKFAPLTDDGLADQIAALLQKLKFKTAGIFVMDGSRRSSHGNAYFTGFGKNKRIVLFDTLLSSLDRGGVLAVLAHEIGHQRKHHVKKLIVLSLALMLAAFWVVSLLLEWPVFFSTFGLAEPSLAGALALLMFASSPVFFFLSPLLSSLTRKYEFEADRFAVDALGRGEPLRSALIALSIKNLSNLTPHPWYSFFYYSHPTLAERVRAIENYGG